MAAAAAAAAAAIAAKPAGQININLGGGGAGGGTGPARANGSQGGAGSQSSAMTQRSVYDFDIEGVEDKPWTKPGASCSVAPPPPPPPPPAPPLPALRFSSTSARQLVVQVCLPVCQCSPSQEGRRQVWIEPLSGKFDCEMLCPVGCTQGFPYRNGQFSLYSTVLVVFEHYQYGDETVCYHMIVLQHC